MKIRIQNFQSLADVSIEAVGLTVIKGGSNLGKSAFVRAVTSALFNRSGGFFVRKGSQNSIVTLSEVPTVKHGTHEIQWEKGSVKACTFKIDKEPFDKVGTDVPAHLEMWGYKDLLIDKTYIRPQVADQFDGFFLLGRSGSFISDVLTMASRLAVLLRASDFCTGDLKRSKQTSTIRKEDLVTAEQKLQRMRPIIDLSTRVKAIGPKLADVSKSLAELQERQKLVAEYKALQPTRQLQVPVHVNLPVDLGVKHAEVRQLLEHRRKLVDLPQLPETVPGPMLTAVDMRTVHLLEIRSLLERRPKQLPALPSTVDRSETLVKLDGVQRIADNVRSLALEYANAKRYVHSTRTAWSSLVTEGEELDSQLAGLLSDVKICPVCDRPMVEQAQEVLQ